ncbi:hypothetical protein, partial [Streptomyces sparsus]
MYQSGLTDRHGPAPHGGPGRRRALWMRLLWLGVVLGALMAWFQHAALDRSWPAALALGCLFAPVAAAA